MEGVETGSWNICCYCFVVDVVVEGFAGVVDAALIVVFGMRNEFVVFVALECSNKKRKLIFPEIRHLPVCC